VSTAAGSGACKHTPSGAPGRVYPSGSHQRTSAVPAQHRRPVTRDHTDSHARTPTHNRRSTPCSRSGSAWRVTASPATVEAHTPSPIDHAPHRKPAQANPGTPDAAPSTRHPGRSAATLPTQPRTATTADLHHRTTRPTAPPGQPSTTPTQHHVREHQRHHAPPSSRIPAANTDAFTATHSLHRLSPRIATAQRREHPPAEARSRAHPTNHAPTADHPAAHARPMPHAQTQLAKGHRPCR
jgi:hypothetical protein